MENKIGSLDITQFLVYIIQTVCGLYQTDRLSPVTQRQHVLFEESCRCFCPFDPAIVILEEKTLAVDRLP